MTRQCLRLSTVHNYVYLKYNNILGPSEKQDGYSLCYETKECSSTFERLFFELNRTIVLN